MYFKNEKNLLFITRYLLSITILLFSIFLTTFLYFENKEAFEKIKQETEIKFINEKKQLLTSSYKKIVDKKRSIKPMVKVF